MKTRFPALTSLLFWSLCFLLSSNFNYAETVPSTFTLTSIQEKGPKAHSFNIVFIPDGYTQNELSKFQADTQKCVDAFFAQPVFKEYQNYFNLYRIDIPSNESGSDHPELNTSRDTYFNSTYNFANLPRLLYANTSGITRIFDTVAHYVPEYNQIIVIVNDTTYGGSAGGNVSFVCNGPEAPEILLHELGHSMGRLSDEYDYSEAPTTGSTANLTTATTRATVPWNNWISSSTPVPTTTPTTITTSNAVNPVGLYANSGIQTGAYRPTADSRMRSLYRPYGAVNEEALLLQIYSTTPICSGFTPSFDNISGSLKTLKTFSINDPKSPSHPLTITWTLDGNIIPDLNTPTVNLWSHQIGNGAHTLTATITDNTTTLDGNRFVLTDTNQLTQKSKTWNLNFWNQVPYITPIENIILTVNTQLSQSISAKNTPTFTATGLPVGIQIDQTTGLITGSTQTPGSYPVTLIATNAIGTDTVNFTITVPPPPQFLTTETNLNAVITNSFSVSLATDQTATISASNLPPGLSLNSTTQILTGVPTTTGSYTTTITATNTNGTTQLALNFVVTNPPLTLTNSTPPVPIIPQNYSFQFLSSNTSTFSSTNLPPGLTLNTITGILSGVPTSPGSYSISISVTDTYQQTLSQGYTLTIPIPPSLTSISPIQTTLNLPFSTQLTASENATFSAANIPAGMSFTTSGLLTGTPTEYGTFRPTVTTSNSNGSSATQITLTIIPPPLVISTPNLSTARVGNLYEAQITTNNNATYSATGLPNGLQLNTTTGTISGIPTQTGTFTVTISTNDIYGQSLTSTPITIDIPIPPPSPQISQPPNFTVLKSITPITIPMAAGVNLAISALPSGLVYIPTSSTIEGTPTRVGTFPVTITASNQNGTSKTIFQITVNPPPNINLTENQTYYALLPHPNNEIATFTLQKTRSFSARIPIQGMPIHFRGSVDQTGSYSGQSTNRKFQLQLIVQPQENPPIITAQITEISTQTTTEINAIAALGALKIPKTIPGGYTYTIISQADRPELTAYGTGQIAIHGLAILSTTFPDGTRSIQMTRLRADLTLAVIIHSKTESHATALQTSELASATSSEVSITNKETRTLYSEKDTLLWNKIPANNTTFQKQTLGQTSYYQDTQEILHEAAPPPFQFGMNQVTARATTITQQTAYRDKISIFIRSQYGTFTGRILQTSKPSSVIHGIYEEHNQTATGLITIAPRTYIPFRIKFQEQ